MSFPEVARVVAILTLAVGCSGQRVATARTEFGPDAPSVDVRFATWDRRGSPGCALAVSRRGTFFSTELDATYRLANSDRGLSLRIEQEPPLDVAPVAADEFRFVLGDQAYSGVMAASLKFRRGAGGTVAGFALSSGTERGIAFERLR